MSQPMFITGIPVDEDEGGAVATTSSQSYPPTDEQQRIIEAFNTGSNLIARAGAGTGKTSTIAFLADALHTHRPLAKAVYITLNKDMVADISGRFVHGNVYASTIHALAYRATGAIPAIRALLPKLNAPAARTPRQALGKKLGITDRYVYTTQQGENLAATGRAAVKGYLTISQVYAQVLATVTNFCRSDDPSITVDHVPRIRSIPQHTHDDDYAPMVARLARKLWETDICNPKGSSRFSHDHYLKLVCSTRCDIARVFGLPEGSVLFFDEAQDCRPCVHGWLSSQKNLQLVYVGDSAQAIYGSFTGSIDALSTLEEEMPDAHRATLTRSFRFGTSIANYANDVLGAIGESLRLRGLDSIDSAVRIYESGNTPIDWDTTDCVLVRTNASAIAFAESAQQRGVPYRLRINEHEVLNLMSDLRRIESGARPTSYKLAPVRTMEDLHAMLQAPETENDLDKTDRLLIQMALTAPEGTYYVESLIRGQAKRTADRYITFSTIHKAKGQQWNNVVVATDTADSFDRLLTRGGRNHESQERVEFLLREEAMLYYVAVTRARHEVSVYARTHEFVGYLRDHRFRDYALESGDYDIYQGTEDDTDTADTTDTASSDGAPR